METAIRRPVGQGTLEIVQGDITDLQVDAVVNPANRALQLGGGVAGSIRRRGGPVIQEECDAIGGCPEGGAVVTGAGDLAARWVVHAVGPVWGRQTAEESDRILASACREALARASEQQAASIAIPSISTGIFGFPLDRAARILLGEAASHLNASACPSRVVFCLFDAEAFETYRGVLDEVLAR